ncbi:hypothetical protein NMG60_11032850 [Bertholletia excelsa]
MSPLSTNDLNRIFHKLDRNRDGFVSLDELKWLLERIGVQTSEDELQSLVGKNSLDMIDFMLFYDSVIKENLEEQRKTGDREEDEERLERELAQAFKVYDLNGDGFISSEELQSVLSGLGLWNEHCGRDCRSMIKVFDTNSDGLLDFEEFKNMMLVSNP